MALQAKDLTIGDWMMVYPWDETPWKPKKITDINFHSWEGVDFCDSVGVEGWDELSLDQIKPIPLTAEILEKNEFRKRPYPNIEKHHQWILCAGSTIKLWCCRLYDDADDGWMIDINAFCNSCRIKIKYLHELQHALKVCGIEKTIELDQLNAKKEN